MENVNINYLNRGISDHETRSKDKQLFPLSEVSFYKGINAGGIRSGTNRRNFEQRNVPIELLKKENMKLLIRYLTWQEYPNSISVNDLQTPHRSLLISLWNFILKKIDKNIEINTKNANEEIPRIFKELGYPLTISKSSMVAPGTGHQWTHHLNALCWLCELLIYENEIFPTINSGEGYLNFDPSNSNEEENETHLTFNKLISKNFIVCMLAKEKRNSIKNVVFSQLEMDLETIRSAYSQKQEIYMKFQSELDEKEGILEEHKNKEVLINELEEKYTKLQQQIDKEKLQISTNQNDIEQLQNILFNKNEEYKQQMNAIKDLTTVLSKQKINKEEIYRIRKSIEECKVSLENNNKKLESLKNDFIKKDEEFEQLVQESQSLCVNINQNYNEFVIKAKATESKSFEIWENISPIKYFFDAKSSDEMLNISWKDQKNMLADIITAEEEYLEKIKTEAPEELIESKEEDLVKLNENLNNSKKKNEQLKVDLDELNNNMQQKFNKIRNEIEIKNKEMEAKEMNFLKMIKESESTIEKIQNEIKAETYSHFESCISKWKEIQKQFEVFPNNQIQPLKEFKLPT